ncbi:hypothetical protein [Myxosarcina sp. GI1(2024)]
MLNSQYLGREGRPPHSKITDEQTSTDRFRDSSENLAEAAERELDFEIRRELEYLKNLVTNGTHVPLTELVILDRQMILDRLEIIKRSLPVQLATAIEITEQQEEIVRRTEAYVERLVSSAEEKAAAAVRESSLMRRAELAAAKLKLQTERECERLRQMAISESEEIIAGADSYADRVLANIEQQLNDMLSVVKNGRQQLEGQKQE